MNKGKDTMKNSEKLMTNINKFINDNSDRNISKDDYKKSKGILIKKFVPDNEKKGELEALMSFKFFIKHLLEEGSNLS